MTLPAELATLKEQARKRREEESRKLAAETERLVAVHREAAWKNLESLKHCIETAFGTGYVMCGTAEAVDGKEFDGDTVSARWQLLFPGHHVVWTRLDRDDAGNWRLARAQNPWSVGNSTAQLGIGEALLAAEVCDEPPF